MEAEKLCHIICDHLASATLADGLNASSIPQRTTLNAHHSRKNGSEIQRNEKSFRFPPCPLPLPTPFIRSLAFAVVRKAREGAAALHYNL
eukprot:scaffold349_cov157-Skeletonema_dohrnii-CCMP3373.AAC.16